MDEIEELKSAIGQLTAVKEMLSMPGWKIIENHFLQYIESISEQLDIEDNFETIRRLQERKRAFKSMLVTVNSLSQQHSEALLRLEAVQEDHNERDQYGLNS